MNHSNESNMHHRQAWELLPWCVNGTASEEECRLVETHLKQCEDCREEFAFQRRLRAGMTLDIQAAPDPAPGLDRLWERIDSAAGQDAEDKPSAALAKARGRRPLFNYGLAAMVVLQAGVLAVFGAQFLMQHQEPGDATGAYATLSSPGTSAARATIRIVPAPAMRIEELGNLLLRLQLQIVAGPSEAGVYSLAPTAERYDTAGQLAQLRAIAGIRFAEPAGTMAGITAGAP